MIDPVFNSGDTDRLKSKVNHYDGELKVGELYSDNFFNVIEIKREISSGEFIGEHVDGPLIRELGDEYIYGETGRFLHATDDSLLHISKKHFPDYSVTLRIGDHYEVISKSDGQESVEMKLVGMDSNFDAEFKFQHVDDKSKIVKMNLISRDGLLPHNKDYTIRENLTDKGTHQFKPSVSEVSKSDTSDKRVTDEIAHMMESPVVVLVSAKHGSNRVICKMLTSDLPKSAEIRSTDSIEHLGLRHTHIEIIDPVDYVDRISQNDDSLEWGHSFRSYKDFCDQIRSKEMRFENSLVQFKDEKGTVL